MMDTIWTTNGSGGYIAGTYDFGNYVLSHGVEAGFESVICFSKDQKDSVIFLTNQHISTDALVRLSKTFFSQLGPYKIKQ